MNIGKLVWKAERTLKVVKAYVWFFDKFLIAPYCLDLLHNISKSLLKGKNNQPKETMATLPFIFPILSLHTYFPATHFCLLSSLKDVSPWCEVFIL